MATAEELKKQVGMVKHLIDRAHLKLELLPGDELPDAVQKDLTEAQDRLETITLEF